MGAMIGFRYFENQRILSEQRQRALVDLENHFKQLEKACILILSDNAVIGGGVVVKVNVKGKWRPFIFTARHVLDAAIGIAENEGSFHFAFISNLEADKWNVIDVPFQSLQWFDGGEQSDTIAINLYGGASYINERGGSLYPIKVGERAYSACKNQSVRTICPDMYRNLGNEAKKRFVTHPFSLMKGVVTEVNSFRQVNNVSHIVTKVDFENFMKSGYSGSPVFAVMPNENLTHYDVQYFGNLILAIDGGIEGGVSSFEELLSRIQREANRFQD